MPSWAQPRSTWHLDTNTRGMRDEEYTGEKPAGVFRIAMLGDSWTVGVNVERPDTIPDQLERRAAERFPHGRFEVLNFGMIGAGLETGRRLLPLAVAADPDVVVLAYAQNDEARIAPGSRRDRTPASSSPEADSWQRAFDALEVLRLYRYLTAPSRHSARATIQRELTSTGGVPLNAPARMCPNAGGQSYSDYGRLLDELIAGVRRSGAEPVLVYDNVPEFHSHCTRMALNEASRRRRVPLLDSAALLAAAATALEERAERELHLEPGPEVTGASEGRITAVFRVDMSKAVPRGSPGIMGSDPVLGDFVPNSVALFDDGSHGDQNAGDLVYAGSFQFTDPVENNYTFTNGDRVGAWVGLENYHPRVFALRDQDRGRTVYLPVAQFGRPGLRSDASHPDAAGYGLIAEGLLDLLESMPGLRRYLAAIESARESPMSRR
jgi:lysophospholipase L1-like esterase